MTASAQIAARHFGCKTVKALTRKGIRVTGLQACPTGRFADYDTCYVVDDNGTGRVLSFTQVREAAQ